MRGHGWEDPLEVPIIENKATEEAIAEGLEVSMFIICKMPMNSICPF
jgi:hypothetical protein